jgi:hypothetical protein
MTEMLFAFLLTLACAALVTLIVAAARSKPDPGDRDDDAGSEGGGSDRLPGDSPLRPPGAGEPAWWPQFERDFADYAAGRRLVSAADEHDGRR